MPATEFRSFDPSLVAFLGELAGHNDRDWFAANKERYESDVLAPALDFIEAMAPHLEKIAPHFRAIAKRQGGSLMRVYRDTRFARDKRPYKTNVGIQFRHEAGRDVHAPGYYFHIDPDTVFLGAGLWHPERNALAAIRDRIVAHPARWRAARDDKAFRGVFELGGESLKRPPRGYDADHPEIDDLKRKDFIATCHLTHADLYKRTLVGNVIRRLQAATPFMTFLCQANGVRI